MENVREGEATSPLVLDYIENSNDDFTCLTQLEKTREEMEFLKKHCGDGWNDTPTSQKELDFMKKYRGDGYNDAPVLEVRTSIMDPPSYDINKLEKEMYTNK